MKKFITLMIATFVCSQLIAQVLTVSNNTNSPGQFTSLNAAIAAANPGDTIYLHGSPSSYGTVTVNKRLTIIGPGFNPQSQFYLSATVTQLVLDSISPVSGASGTKFIGISFDNIFKKTTEFWQINDITFERCRFSSSTTRSYISGNNWTFINCYFYFANNNINLEIGYYSNILFANNVFYFANLNNSNSQTVPALINSNKSSVIITNNLFTGYHQGNSFSSISNAQITNNIFWGKSPFGASASVYSNNLSYGNTNDSLPPPGNTGQNNLKGIDPLFVNVPIGNYLYSYSYDFDLTPASPAKNAGTDGTDIGIYGGTYPMLRNNNVITGEPRIPQVYYMNILNNVIDQNTPINVTVKARKME